MPVEVPGNLTHQVQTLENRCNELENRVMELEQALAQLLAYTGMNEPPLAQPNPVAGTAMGQPVGHAANRP